MPTALLPVYEAGLIQLNPGLPCAMRKPTGQRCGQPATVAWSDPILVGLNSGSWYLIPICRDCAQSAMELYGQTQPHQEPASPELQNSAPRLNGLAALSSLKGA